MSTLTINQALDAAKQGGWSGARLVLIVSIAMAESGLRTDAYNSKDPNGGSWGIVQINGAHFHSGGTTKTCALTPVCAFQYAYTLSKQGTDFTPWGAYTNGSYKQFEKDVAAAFSGSPADVISASISNLVGGSSQQPDQITAILAQMTSLQNLFTTLTSPDTWIRIALFLVALIAVIIGFLILSHGDQPAPAGGGA